MQWEQVPLFFDKSGYDSCNIMKDDSGVPLFKKMKSTKTVDKTYLRAKQPAQSILSLFAIPTLKCQ